MSHFDVVINGAGLVGACLARGLADRGLKVGVIEAIERQANHQPSYDDRTLVINQASLNILANLGLLPDTLPREPLRHIVVNRAGRPGFFELHARDHGCEAFGAVIVARELGNVLLDALERHPAITLLCPQRLDTFQVATDAVTLTLADGGIVPARLLVGADGNDSLVRRLAGLHCDKHDYGQSAMIFNIRPEKAPSGTAWERFTPQGPLALLPQPAGRLGVVWIDRHEAIDEAMHWDDDRLCRRLEQRFGRQLGGFSQPGRRARYALVRQRTEWPVARRVVVVGNAANAVHPVSAQGFNLGLRDAAALIDQLAGRQDAGDWDGLRAYAHSRAEDQAATVRYTDTLARAFTNPSALAGLMAGAGLFAHAALPALQRRLVRAAMGFREPTSSLARPPEAAR